MASGSLWWLIAEVLIMQDYFHFLIDRKIYITWLVELISALVGSFYLWKTEKPSKLIRQFVWFLWSVFIIDVLGGYSPWAYFDNYETFPFLKGSLIERNFWWFNLGKVYFILAYCYFLKEKIRNKKARLYIKWVMVAFLGFAVYSMIFSGYFFTSYITRIFLVGTFLILGVAFVYFYDIMIGDRLFSFHKNLFTYVAIGLIVWYLVIPPIEIYVDYFLQGNDFYINVFASVLRYANIFLYSMFALGFLVQYKNHKE